MPKQCFKCGATKPLSDFYRHPMMADGRLGKCKECTKRDVSENYAKKREQYAEYYRARSTTPERKKYEKERRRRRRAKDAEKFAARAAVTRAVRAGKLVRGRCSVCGSRDRVEGHHADYSKPLDVEWLCFKCHRGRHGQETTEFARRMADGE